MCMLLRQSHVSLLPCSMRFPLCRLMFKPHKQQNWQEARLPVQALQQRAQQLHQQARDRHLGLLQRLEEEQGRWLACKTNVSCRVMSDGGSWWLLCWLQALLCGRATAPRICFTRSPGHATRMRSVASQDAEFSPDAQVLCRCSAESQCTSASFRDMSALCCGAWSGVACNQGMFCSSIFTVQSTPLTELDIRYS